MPLALLSRASARVRVLCIARNARLHFKLLGQSCLLGVSREYGNTLYKDHVGILFLDSLLRTSKLEKTFAYILKALIPTSALVLSFCRCFVLPNRCKVHGKDSGQDQSCMLCYPKVRHAKECDVDGLATGQLHQPRGLQERGQSFCH